MLSQSALDTISSKIIQLRLKRGLSQAALALMLDVDQATVSRWERRQQLPTRPVQLRLAALFDAVTANERRRSELDFVRHSPFPIVAFDVDRLIHAASATIGIVLGALDMNSAIAAASDERFFEDGGRTARVIARIQELDGDFDYADQIWTPHYPATGGALIVAQLQFIDAAEFRKRRDRFGLFRLLD